jgi:hypothetical protein
MGAYEITQAKPAHVALLLHKKQFGNICQGDVANGNWI